MLDLGLANDEVPRQIEKFPARTERSVLNEGSSCDSDLGYVTVMSCATA